MNDNTMQMVSKTAWCGEILATWHEKQLITLPLLIFFHSMRNCKCSFILGYNGNTWVWNHHDYDKSFMLIYWKEPYNWNVILRNNANSSTTIMHVFQNLIYQ
jgi:hypothetical protein